MITALIFGACETTPPIDPDNESAVQQLVYTINIDQDKSGQFVATLPDGTVFIDQATYEQAMPAIATKVMQDGYRIEIAFGENIASELDNTFGLAQHGQSIQDTEGIVRSELNVGWGYNVTIGAGYKYVSGCVKSNAYRVAVRLNHYSNQVFDLHLATYTKNGYPCFGAYESVYAYINWCTCSPVSYNQVKDAIYKAAIAAGISTTIAAAIATAATPVAFSALAL